MQNQIADQAKKEKYKQPKFNQLDFSQVANYSVAANSATVLKKQFVPMIMFLSVMPSRTLLKSYFQRNRRLSRDGSSCTPILLHHLLKLETLPCLSFSHLQKDCDQIQQSSGQLGRILQEQYAQCKRYKASLGCCG